MTKKTPLTIEQMREVSRLLKAADRFTLRGDFDEALAEVKKALKIEPHNEYALAYEDRIATFRKEAEQRKKEEAHQAELEAKLKAEREARRKSEEDAKARLAMEDKPFEARKELYSEKLAKVWAQGKPSAGQKSRLRQLRESLNLSDEEHHRLEAHVRLKSFVAAIKDSWEQGKISPTSTEILDELRTAYDVSSEEHLAIESQILWQLQGARNKGIVLVVDDDEDYLKVMGDILRANGYTPISCISPEEGQKALKKTMPDLILLDINFPKPSMSGFLFYEKIREQERFDVVPVIFVSALNEDNIILAGKQLGADDYITKPFSEDTLVASMEGRLRRYQSLKSKRKRDSS